MDTGLYAKRLGKLPLGEGEIVGRHTVSRHFGWLVSCRFPLLALVLTWLVAGCGSSGGNTIVVVLTPTPTATATVSADSIFENGVVETMDSSMTTAQAVAVSGGRIIAVGTNAQAEAFQRPDTTVFDLKGAALLPGFIDTHSHMMGWGAGYTNIVLNPNWVDISSQNMFFKPHPGDPRCANSSDYEKCFIPVQTQDDVLERLQAAIAAAPSPAASPAPPIVGFNYDPARLGHCTKCTPPPVSSGCPGKGVGFSCPNFEDGNALTYLNQLSTTYPIYIVSESGHIVYVNSPALALENICPPASSCPKNPVPPPAGCTTPSINPCEEEAMAQYGQLNEDLALAAESKLAAGDGTNPTSFVKIVSTAASAYAQHGYTLIQEGAATPAETAVYELATLDPQFPVLAANLIYDPKATDANIEVIEALALRRATEGNPNILVAGPKVFADGSVQGLTAFVGGSGYLPGVTDDTLYAPSFGIWPQPYVGAADFTESQIASAAKLAHEANFPLFIHQNGTGAIENALTAMQAAGTKPNLHDLMIHFSMATPGQISMAQHLGVGVTFLMENLYYLGLPLCQQLLGYERTAQLFPAASAIAAGLRISLHPDTTVTAPDPLFAIWVAKTRMTQQPSWYPNNNASTCPVVMDVTDGNPSEKISIAQGVQAYTINAAAEYGLDQELGSVEVGKRAEFAIFSADPLTMESTPNNLSTIRTIATVHNGTYFANPNADEPPIWPD